NTLSHCSLRPPAAPISTLFLRDALPIATRPPQAQAAFRAAFAPGRQIANPSRSAVARAMEALPAPFGLHLRQAERRRECLHGSLHGGPARVRDLLALLERGAERRQRLRVPR